MESYIGKRAALKKKAIYSHQGEYDTSARLIHVTGIVIDEYDVTRNDKSTFRKDKKTKLLRIAYTEGSIRSLPEYVEELEIS